MKYQLKQKIIAGTIALLMGLSVTMPAFADNRDAGSFTKINGVQISRSNNVVYYPNNEGGFTVYVPYSQKMSGNKIFTSMFKDLFNIYKDGVGSHYASAGGRYTAPNLSNISGINTSYYVKKLSIGGLQSNTGNITSADKATSDLHQLELKYNLEFRYAGIAVNYTGKGTVVTNPSYPSDFLSSSSSGGAANSYQIYDKAGKPVDSVTLYGTTNLDVIQRANLKKDWPGTSGVPTNKPNTETYPQAEAVFERWAALTPIGAAYKAAYAVNPNGAKWWEYLRDYIRIDGNYKEQSVLLTVVWSDAKGTYYRTYGIPYQIESNMVASKLQILDDKKNVLDYSERPLILEDAISGAVDMETNVVSGSAVKLERNKTYYIESAFTFLSAEKTKTVTNKNSSGALPDFIVEDNTTSENTFKEYVSAPTTNIQNMTAEERSLLDSSTSGPINTKKTMTTGLTRSGDESIVYNCGLSGYKNMSFTVDETFPTDGIIRIVIPDTFAQNGDNDYQTDDYLDLNFTLDETPPPPPTDGDPATGDLNLGQRELRSYHYLEIIQEEDPEKPIIVKDPVTGAETVTGYEMKPVPYEYASDYGTHTSSVSGDKVGEWQGVPEASGSIYPIDDSSWWEYSQEWPDQSEDAKYKIWLTRNGESWNENDEEYIRSEIADYPFDLGFSVSRSRGSTSDSIIPHLNVSLFGISPDTDESGDLIGTYRVAGPNISTYQYNSGNYLYLLHNYISSRYPSGEDYPRVRVVAEIDKKHHGESGIYGDSTESPYHNGWQDDHDTHERVFEAQSDDMELTDVKIYDSEGIIVYHATRDEGNSWETKVRGYFDKEEDYTMDVKLKQTIASGHNVKNPTIDVSIYGENVTGGTVSTYVDRSIQNEETLGLEVETVYENIAFRPKDVSAIKFNISINNIHGSSNWRENIWNAEEDSFSDKILCTTANLKVSPNIELYNSKYNLKNYMTFAEKLSFKYDIQHIGEGERQTAIVGDSKINPLAKLDIAIYDADALSKDQYGNLLYDNVKTFDPKATGALIWTGTAQAQSRLYPGLGAMNYSAHVQAWTNNYVVQARETLSKNKAAYGRILVTAKINDEMKVHGLNENTSSAEDYVQQEFIGEHNLAIADMVVTGQNSVSDNAWYYSSSNRDKETGDFILPNKNGISVSVAISNTPSSYADPTVIDRTYLDIYIDNAEVPNKTVIIDIPQGDTIPIEVVIPDVLIKKDLKVTAKVNHGNHQTHYEYVLPSTSTELNKDPFTDNVGIRTVSPNMPDREHAPNAEIIDGLPAEITIEN